MATSDVRGLQRNYQTVFATAGAFTTMAIGTTILRMVSRYLTKTPLHLEDYFSLLASAIFILIEGLMCKAVYVGAQVETINDPADQQHTMFIFIYGQMYYQVMTFSILSILVLYRRIFFKRSVKITTTVLIVCTALWWIPCTIISIIYPNNLPQTFPGNPMQPQLHIVYLNFWLGASIAETIFLIIAVIIPIVAIKNLQMSLRKKTFNMMVFAVSLACIGTGMARLGRLYRPHGGDFDPSIGDIFQNVHLGTAIMSVNLPLCWPIISQRKKILSLFSSSSSSKFKSTGSSGSRSTDVIESRKPSDATIVESRTVRPKQDTAVREVENVYLPQNSLMCDTGDSTYSVDQITVAQSNESRTERGSHESVLPRVHLRSETKADPEWI